MASEFHVSTEVHRRDASELAVGKSGSRGQAETEAEGGLFWAGRVVTLFAMIAQRKSNQGD